MAKARRKRIVLMSDTHCGHRAGLTPPDWQYNPEVSFEPDASIGRAQQEAWNWYASRVKALRPVYAVFANGDLIDGTGHRSGGTEQITTDRNKQADMAKACIRQWKADRHVFTFGTGYHTGDAEDFELNIADAFGAKIGSHEWVDVNGLVFDLRHHVGSSSVPHGRFTAIARQKLWNALWARDDAQPEARFIVRSHVHYHAQISGIENGRQWVAMTLPALQLANTKYGGRRCDGIVNFGFVVVDVDEHGGFTWWPEIAVLANNKADTLSL